MFLNILLVDDMKSALKDIMRAMEKIGVDVEIDFRCPEDSEIQFGCELPSGRELEAYDIAIVDLELFPDRSSLEYQPEDLRGGTEVLPYLRSEAPWLPVIGFSRLFVDDARHFIAVAGSFGFDGHLPRQVINSHYFNRNFWEEYIERVRLVRNRELLGQNYKVEVEPADSQIEVDQTVGIELDDKLPGWRLLTRRLLHFADKIIIEGIPGGFSGAVVFRAITFSRFKGIAKEAAWLVKVSSSPHKLYRESAAHQRFSQVGLDYARSVPLLWKWPVVISATGGICYQFATGSRTATESIRVGSSEADVRSRIGKLLQDMYEENVVDRSITRKLLFELGPGSQALTKGISMLRNCDAKIMVAGLIDEKLENSLLAQSIGYKSAWIHGDLHLGNILLGERDLLIDFAHAGAGPVVVDLVRICLDFCVLGLEEWPTTFDAIGELLDFCRQEDFLTIPLEDGDCDLFKLFFVVWSVAFLGYGVLEADAKKRAVELIETFSFLG